MTAGTRTCWKCGEPMTAVAKFCGACGSPTRVHSRAIRDRLYSEDRDRQRAIKAMASVFVLVLVSLVVSALWFSDDAGTGFWEPSVSQLAANAVLDIATGVIGILVLGKTTLRASFSGTASIGQMGLGLAVVPVTLAVSYGFVALIDSLLASGTPAPEVPLTLTSFVGIAVLPAVLEEWLCRGVLWEASIRVVSPGRTVVATAVLFAMMHGLGGGFVLELPHRFVMGLVFGWLRLRTGSLLPSMLAHFAHNAVCLI